MLEAVVFDFDGLILETETPEVRSWEAVFRHHGAEYPEWYWRYTLGRGAEQVMKGPYDLLVEQGVRAERDDVLRMRGHLLAEMLAELEILPGVVDRIREAQALGAKLGVASSSKHAWVDGHLDRLGLLPMFDEVVCADDVERAKPFPDLYRLCCDRMGASPRRSVAFEDSANGARAAKEAGLYVVAVPTHLTNRDELVADRIVDSLAEISLAELSASLG
ncbi:MAG TPA: HAD family phosphatase [Fimbriimonadaceae bacterium]|nr:HAD family phosphatase [Fimbriimonadaceae bacterium]